MPEAAAEASGLRGAPELPAATRPPPTAQLHPAYHRLIREYPFQPCRTERGQLVNVIFVRSPFRSAAQEEMYERYKDEILFVGISSFEDFPLPPPNPYSGKFPKDKYVGMFPGFLHMMREPEKFFPPHVKLLLMSQSDFALPYPGRRAEKKYDFIYSGSDQDVHNDCEGWSSFAKNWTFAKQALEVMCGEYGLTGVLVATKDKQNKKACTIPTSCHGKVLQTQYIPQNEFFDYMRQSRWVFFPQVHDASPRVTTQALMHDLPMLMNWHIAGGWKYLNEKTGEFFHDMSDFRSALGKIVDGTRTEPSAYSPRKWVSEHYGDSVSGPRLKDWVLENFADRVALPRGTRSLLPSGA